MIRRLGILLLMVIVTPKPAEAQQSEDAFCASAPDELLAAIEGDWSLTQGAGFFVVGPQTMPLPSHPPKAISITYDPTDFHATVTAPDGRMILIPTAEDSVTADVPYLNDKDAEKFLGIGAGCDHYALPLMLGANVYSLNRAQGAYRIVWLVLGEVSVPFCSGADASKFTEEYWRDTGEELVIQPGPDPTEPLHKGIGVGSTDIRDTPDSAWFPCPFKDSLNSIPEAAEGEMTMTLIVKFRTPDFATGLLQFHGQMEGHKFAAKAPVTLSR